MLTYFAAFMVLFFESCIAINDQCSASNHPVFNKKDFKASFEKQALMKDGMFRSIVLNGKDNQLIVGGKNKWAVLNAETLQTIHEENWETDKNSCLNEGHRDVDLCNNYITYLNIFKDKLVACGTGSYKPVYRVILMKDYSTIKEHTMDGVCASPNPSHRIVGQLTSLGEMIAGTYIRGSTAGVVGSYVTEKMTFYREDLKTASEGIKENSEFIQSFYIKDSVYVFFMEAAEEKENEYTATVGRFCQTDNGASSFISNQHWTTFRKARLTCRYEGKSDKTIFKNLVDIIYDEEKSVFYAAFTMTRQYKLGSAICSFAFDDIESVFTKNYLKKDVNTNKWKEVKNQPILDGCSVNKTYLRKDADLMAPKGKQPTNKLNVKSSIFLSQHLLMADNVVSKSSQVQYMKPFTRFARLSLDKMNKKAGDDSIVINVIDENGNILMLHSIGKGKEPCIIEEIETGIKNPQIFLMNEKLRLLYVSSSTISDLHAINVDNCQRYVNKSECLNSHNVRCGWDDEMSQCLSLAQSRKNTLMQSLTRCPKRNDIVGNWSPWKPQKQYDGTERYCLTRNRQCLLCDKSQCSMETLQVTNCTSNRVNDVGSWFKNGPVHGSWSNWKGWSACQAQGLCGNRTLIRYRECSNPPASNGGNNCVGNNFQCSTCQNKEIVLIVWSEWGPWVTAKQTNDEIHQQRTRICSKPNQCIGKGAQSRIRPTRGTCWGEWSDCNDRCIRHRVPLYVNGCDDKECLKMQKAEYQQCPPDECQHVKPDNNTTNNTDTKLVDIIPSYDAVPTQKCKDGYTFELIELVSIGVGIVACSFLIIVIIVLLIIRRNRKNNTYSPNSIRKTKSQPLLEVTDTLDSNSQESNAFSAGTIPG